MLVSFYVSNSLIRHVTKNNSVLYTNIKAKTKWTYKSHQRKLVVVWFGSIILADMKILSFWKLSWGNFHTFILLLILSEISPVWSPCQMFWNHWVTSRINSIASNLWNIRVAQKRPLSVLCSFRSSFFHWCFQTQRVELSHHARPHNKNRE